LDTLALHLDDIIVTSDLDELLDPRILVQLKAQSLPGFDRDRLNRVALDMYYYNLNTRIGKENWHGIKILTYKTYRKAQMTFEQMRTYEWKHHVPIIRRGGWHLSYFGNIDFIKNKIQNFSHQEFNNAQYVNNEFIAAKIAAHQDMFHGRQFEYVPTRNNDYLPPDYQIWLKDFIVE
jgi:beta-1,4-mannosyl-glycoprotein beta-1,4-N-acetylglucosaminyltransferase